MIGLKPGLVRHRTEFTMIKQKLVEVLDLELTRINAYVHGTKKKSKSNTSHDKHIAH